MTTGLKPSLAKMPTIDGLLRTLANCRCTASASHATVAFLRRKLSRSTPACPHICPTSRRNCKRMSSMFLDVYSNSELALCAERFRGRSALSLSSGAGAMRNPPSSHASTSSSCSPSMTSSRPRRSSSTSSSATGDAAAPVDSSASKSSRLQSSPSGGKWSRTVGGLILGLFEPDVDCSTGRFLGVSGSRDSSRAVYMRTSAHPDLILPRAQTCSTTQPSNES